MDWIWRMAVFACSVESTRDMVNPSVSLRTCTPAQKIPRRL
jgi:hypothetical protein